MNILGKFSSLTIVVFILLIASTFLSGCDRIATPKDVASDFWKAVQQQEMEKAKNLSTWDSVDYLKYLNSEKIRPQRFELGEQKVTESAAEIEVTLYSAQQGQSGVKIPGKTMLVKTEQGWRVNVQSTLRSVVSHTVNNVFDQLGNFMRDGLRELDKSLNKSLNELGEALEESANEIKNELSKPLEPAQPQKAEPGAKQI